MNLFLAYIKLIVFALFLFISAVCSIAQTAPVDSQSQQPSANSHKPNTLTMLSDTASELAPDTTAISPADATASVGADTSLKIHSPSGAMWRSLLLPGWGQLYNRHYIKAVVIGGGELALVYAIRYQHQRYLDAKKAGFQEGADFYRDDRNRLTWYLAGSILYSMADAYVDAQLFEFDLNRELALGFDGKQFSVSVHW